MLNVIVDVVGTDTDIRHVLIQRRIEPKNKNKDGPDPSTQSK